MTTAPSTEAWRAAREGCAVFDRSDRDRLRFAGPDATDFLHRLLTRSVTGMEPGDCGPAFLLDARGRVRAALHLLRLDATTFLADCAPGAGAGALAALDQYHFGEDLSLAVAEGFGLLTLQGPGAAGVLASLGAEPPPPGRHGETTLGAVALRIAGGTHGYDLWVPVDAVTDVLSVLSAAGAVPGDGDTLEALRVDAGVPEWPAELNEETTPLEADARAGVTEGKGCYPGQEVIERTIALGRPARALRRLVLEGAAGPGAALALDGDVVGHLTSVATRPDGVAVALALVKHRHVDVAGPFTVEGGGVARPREEG